MKGAIILNQPSVIIMDFWAPWCKLCMRLAPIIEALAVEYQGRVKVEKVNVDEDATTAAKLDVMSIPTLIILKYGRPVERITGVVAKEAIVKKIKQVMAK